MPGGVGKNPSVFGLGFRKSAEIAQAVGDFRSRRGMTGIGGDRLLEIAKRRRGVAALSKRAAKPDPGPDMAGRLRENPAESGLRLVQSTLLAKAVSEV